ncbi:3'-5' exonuclease [Rhodococcus hoagii]|uniref:3'-5' exonuclease n=1 Tax=Rhodococcus hoagii TaxID=43767 RepID=UPI000A108091|nr:exonuclease domain-containing protein [Prescottella equi]NKT99797.1 3'-5' exonuclease [Prescottella equi]NKU00935.1 3'-5' exonuclease [Prescottella equi]NKU01740.1 3'-5' exonuclease [Prescottella equi]NKV36720.1 3'-5' exonuclease [Prescottella equi]NKV37948.1 3'-5' exonuclease [Prescottella equi]
MSTRDLIVVDIETTSLDTEEAVVLEVAAINTTTGVELHFVPALPSGWLTKADPVSLSVNRYFERRLFDEELAEDQTLAYYATLVEMLQSNTFGGSNPRFDAAILARVLDGYGYATAWHHRLADLAAYTAGSIWLEPTDLPGLDRCCGLLGVVNEAPHSALGDARATAKCFERLDELVHERTNRGEVPL